MNFTSLSFLLFFPVVLALYWLLPHRARWVLLLVASYLFYLWEAPWTGLLLAGTTLVSYVAARRLAATSRPLLRRLWLAMGVAVPLGCLAVFKYADFFLSTGAAVLGGEGVTLGLLLPVGISFYTFQTLSYVLDVWRGDLTPEPHLGYYALFVSFFPQLVAGPIERPGHLLPQLKEEHHLKGGDLLLGFGRMALGFFQKIAVADVLAQIADPVFADPQTANGPAVVVGTVCFALQIYCDFAGYSNIALGAARMMGIHLMENFRQPYAAQTIQDFWRRWHISLTQWFTDYVYKPLGGNRAGRLRQCCNVLVVFLLSGLWHGADWTFVVWGGIHGVYLVCGILYRSSGICRFSWQRGRIWASVSQLRTFLLVCLGWVFFRAASLGDALTLLGQLATGWDAGGWASALALTGLGAATALQLLLSLLCLHLLEGYKDRLPEETPDGVVRTALTLFVLIFAVALAWLLLLSNHGESAFLYFQF
jgi:D-alanyl-lipoteichoic acid acyltransferase DltB (MBOAT superfamily)